MNFFYRWLEAQGSLITTQPLSRPVAGMQDAYVQTEGLRKLGWRVVRRKLYLLFHQQFEHHREQIDPDWRRGLWIYFRTAQIGDSLMDLSARSLFSDKNCTIDLWTSDQLAKLYADDDWFHTVTSNGDDVFNQPYDFVVVQSMHHSAVHLKIKHFKSLPWICMQGYYDVPDFDRGPWGVQRLADLYGDSHANPHHWHGRQKLAARHLVDDKLKWRATIVLGGMDPVRTFEKWHQVVGELVSSMALEVTLIGTGKAAQSQSDLIQSMGFGSAVTDLVNQIELQELIRVIAETKLLLVADGGAMHMGVALNVPQMIALFIKGIPPFLRIPEEYRTFSITSQTGLINDIPTQDVLHKVELALTALTVAFPDVSDMRQE